MEREEALPNHSFQRQIQEAFENRSVEEHRQTIDLLMQSMHLSSRQEARVLSMFAVPLPLNDPSIRQNLGIGDLIVQQGKCSQLGSVQQIQELNLSCPIIRISSQSRLQSQSISSIEQEVQFMTGTSYLKLASKKTLFLILKNAHLVPFRFKQNVYCQNQELPAGKADVFLVRSGEFCFQKSLPNQPPIQLYQFGTGTFFGYNQDSTRYLTVNCQSSMGLLYRFTEEFFHSFIYPEYQSLLQINQTKIKSFLKGRIKAAGSSREKHSEIIGHATKRDNFLCNNLLTAPKLLSDSRATQTKMFSLKAKGRDSLPSLGVMGKDPKLQKRSWPKEPMLRLSNPQYQEQGDLLNKKIKSERIQLILGKKRQPGRGQIFLGLIKHSWNFERTKRNKLVP